MPPGLLGPAFFPGEDSGYLPSPSLPPPFGAFSGPDLTPSATGDTLLLVLGLRPDGCYTNTPGKILNNPSLFINHVILPMKKSPKRRLEGTAEQRARRQGLLHLGAPSIVIEKARASCTRPKLSL